MLAFLLAVSFPVLAIYPLVCASRQGAAPSTSASCKLSKRTRIDGRLFDSRLFFPADPGFYREASWAKRAKLEQVLESLLGVVPLIDIVAGYSYGSYARLLAEELYHELYSGQTNLLCRELYDAEKDAVREPHYFWVYLSGAAQPVVAFVHMLRKAQEKHPKLADTLASFAKAVSKKVARAAYFLACYLDCAMPFPLNNISLDEWPQALINDSSYLRSSGCNYYDRAARIEYFLAQGAVGQLKEYLWDLSLLTQGWYHVLYAFHTGAPALLSKFFDLDFSKDSSSDRKLFEVAAPVAISIEPNLKRALALIARQNSWAEPVPIPISIRAQLPDDNEAGGSVHMQPLKPVTRSLDGFCSGLSCAASSTGKTVKSEHGVRLLIVAENVLFVCSTCPAALYAYIRSFERDSVQAYSIASGHSIRVNVQHGDVIFVGWRKECPSFLVEHAYCSGLSGADRFERVKSFCYAAKESWFVFMAIVESDGLVEVGGRAKGLVGAPRGSKMGKRKERGDGKDNGTDSGKDSGKDRGKDNGKDSGTESSNAGNQYELQPS